MKCYFSSACLCVRAAALPVRLVKQEAALRLHFPLSFENIRAVLFIHALAGVIVADEWADEWADPVTFTGAQRQIKMQQTEFAELITRHVACSHASLPAQSRTKHLLSELTALIHFY